MATEIELLQVYLLEDSDDQEDYDYPSCDYLSCACTKFSSSIYLTKYQQLLGSTAQHTLYYWSVYILLIH